MVDSDVVLDVVFEVDEPPGTLVELFACEDGTRPGGFKYSFQRYDPSTGATLLRYDNAHEHPIAGWHHRHDGEDPPESLPFEGLEDHLRRYGLEVFERDE